MELGSDRHYKMADVDVFECSAHGSLIVQEGDANDIIGAAWEHKTDWIVIPVSRFSENFFDLQTRVAGGFLQKFMNYGLRVAIVGDISQHAMKSSALRDFVRESNRGKQVWFLASMEEFAARMG